MKAAGKWISTAAISIWAALAFGNDANISVGGTPKVMGGHPTVRMDREKISMTIGPKKTSVVCDFWFANDGPACTVRMGFPDEGNANEEMEPGKPLESNFDYFRSWVDGKSVATKLIAGAGEAWHVKKVRFPAHATVHVQNRYSAPNGTGICMAGDVTGGCLWESYTVRTGSSWKGKIGRTEIKVTFDALFAPSGLRVVAAKRLSQSADGRGLDKAPFPGKGTIVYRGVAAPSVSGRTLTFVRTDWRPGKGDDLNLWFGYRGPHR